MWSQRSSQKNTIQVGTSLKLRRIGRCWPDISWLMQLMTTLGWILFQGHVKTRGAFVTPNYPCMGYLPASTIEISQMVVNIPHTENMGTTCFHLHKKKVFFHAWWRAICCHRIDAARFKCSFGISEATKLPRHKTHARSRFSTRLAVVCTVLFFLGTVSTWAAMLDLDFLTLQPQAEHHNFKTLVGMSDNDDGNGLGMGLGEYTREIMFKAPKSINNTINWGIFRRVKSSPIHLQDDLWTFMWILLFFVGVGELNTSKKGLKEMMLDRFIHPFMGDMNLTQPWARLIVTKNYKIHPKKHSTWKNHGQLFPWPRWPLSGSLVSN